MSTADKLSISHCVAKTSAAPASKNADAMPSNPELTCAPKSAAVLQAERNMFSSEIKLTYFRFVNKPSFILEYILSGTESANAGSLSLKNFQKQDRGLQNEESHSW